VYSFAALGWIRMRKALRIFMALGGQFFVMHRSECKHSFCQLVIEPAAYDQGFLPRHRVPPLYLKRPL
jgi:hypothetical protein